MTLKAEQREQFRDHIMRGLIVAMAIILAGATVQPAAAGPVSAVGSLFGKSLDSAVIYVGERRRSRGSRARVRGSSRGVGGYSYSYAESLLSFDNTRILRDRDADFDRQGGPFDHGFFFDSGAQIRGGESPYLN